MSSLLGTEVRICDKNSQYYGQIMTVMSINEHDISLFDKSNGIRYFMLDQIEFYNNCYQYEIGDDVWIGQIRWKIGKINDDKAYVHNGGGAQWVSINLLHPYKEPNYKFEVGQHVKYRNNKEKIIADRYATGPDNEPFYIIQTLNGLSPIHVSESDLSIINETTNQNLENMDSNTSNLNKILNLCQILKGHENETFYSLIDGNVKFKEIIDEYSLAFEYHSYHRGGYLFGCSTDGMCLIWPSREMFMKYTDDPIKAWSEWYEINRPRFKFDIKWNIVGKSQTDSAQDSYEFDSLADAQIVMENLRKYVSDFVADFKRSQFVQNLNPINENDDE